MRWSPRDLNEVVSTAVAYLMKVNAPKEMSQALLSKKSGLSQSAISINLKGERGWSMDSFDRVCRAFGVLPEEALTLGRKLLDNKKVFPWLAKLADTSPFSEERLRRIIKLTIGEKTHLAKLIVPASIQEARPEEYARYLKGEIGDGDMFEVIKEIVGYLNRRICK